MPDIWCNVDAAVASLPVNMLALTDDTDFKSIEAAVTFDQAGLALFWNFTTTAGVTTVTAVTPTSSGDYDWTDFTTSGFYGIEMPASGGASVNNDAEGTGWFNGVATGILPWRGPTIGFRAAVLNDTFIDDPTLLLKAGQVGTAYQSVITTVTSQTEFIMTTAFAVDDAWNGNDVTLFDLSTGEYISGNIWISDGIQSTEVLHISTAFPVTVVAGDSLIIKDRQHPTFALDTYDPPTRTEASADKDAIITALDTGVNTTKVKGQTIAGAGTTADPWRPA